MTSAERKPTDASNGELSDPPRWERRLHTVVNWYVLLIIGLGVAARVLRIQPTGIAKQLVDIAFVGSFVAFLPVGFVLIRHAMNRGPTTSRSWAWGSRLLVAGAFGASFLLAYWLITDLVAGWHRASVEILVVAALGALACALIILGLLFVLAALFRDLREYSSERRSSG